VATVEAASRCAPAWRGGFGRLWSAAVLSSFGDALRTAALPLLAVSLTDEPLLIASVTACGYLPWIVFGLLGGAVADRVDQRRAMWMVDALRGLLVAAFAVAVALGHASIGLLIVLAFALTTLQTLFDNAATALLPALVDRDILGSANARLMTGQRIAGGLLGGPVVPLLLAAGAAVPFAADAVTFLVAAALIASLPAAESDRKPRSSGSTLRREIAQGLRTLWRDRALRGLCAATALCNIGMGTQLAMLVVLVTDWLDAGPAGYAAAGAAFTLGGLAGGVVNGRLVARLGRLRSCISAVRAARRLRADRRPRRHGHRAQPRRAGGRAGRLRSHGHGVEHQHDDTDAGAQPRRTAGPGQLGLPDPGLRRRAPRRPAGRSRRHRLGAEHTAAAHGRLLRPRRHRADTRAQCERRCC
jgi:MFS family permease